MLAFLRKIRKSLIETGNSKRYILYAIGEIALVVIGILIALQINNWNLNRMNSIEEQRILASIAQKMEFNRFQHDRGMNRYTEVVQGAERILLRSINDGSTFDPEEMAIDLHLITKRFLMGANNATHLYDELIGSGQLGLISSQELRQKITSLKVDLQLLSAYELLQTTFVDNQLVPYLNKTVDRVSISGIGSKVDSSRYDALVNLDPSIKISSDFAESFERILKDQEFVNLLFELIRQTKRLLPIYNRIDVGLMQIDSLTQILSD